MIIHYGIAVACSTKCCSFIWIEPFPRLRGLFLVHSQHYFDHQGLQQTMSSQARFVWLIGYLVQVLCLISEIRKEEGGGYGGYG